MALAKAAARFRRRLPAPPIVGDDELRSIAIPTLVMLGGRSLLHNATDVAARIDRFVPTALTDVVPAAGHDLPLHSVEHVVTRTLAFVAAQGPI